MTWQRTSTVGTPPVDPLGEALAAAISDVVVANVELAYSPIESPYRPVDEGVAVGAAVADGPPGWRMEIVVRLNARVAGVVRSTDGAALAEMLHVLPDAAAVAVAQLRPGAGGAGAGAAGDMNPALRRALRDTLAAEILARYLGSRLDAPADGALVAEIIDFLIEVSGTRVESHPVTHGVLVTDVLDDVPRLWFRYPADVRAAKRAPLLFDGQRSLLLVDPQGRARTELQRHRFEKLAKGRGRSIKSRDGLRASGALVAEATNVLGGVGFFVRADRSIWTFVDGRPLLVRRGEHWTAFPLELAASIEHMIGGGAVAAIVAQAAFLISAQPDGAILAIVDDASSLDDVVSPKDRYDLRNEIDPSAMRPETRLHHLIDGEELDEQTLVRLATLDGATVVDRQGRLIAYGAIVTSTDSQHEGARTAAARTLSETAAVVLKVSVDGDITIFRDGAPLTTLLSARPRSHG